MRAQRQHRVEPAKGERVGESTFDLGRSRAMGDDVEIAFRVRLDEVSRRREQTLVQGHDGSHRFECTRSAQGVAVHGLGRAHSEPVSMRAEDRSEEHTSELQSPMYLVCRLLLEKK